MYSSRFTTPESAAPTSISTNGTRGPATGSSRRSSSATSSPAKSCQLGREAEAAGLLAVGDLVTAEGHIVVRPLPAVPDRRRPRLPPHPDHRRRSRRLLCRVHRDARLERLASRRHPLPKSAGSWIPMGNAFHTALEARDSRQHRARDRLRADRLLRRRHRQRGRRVARHRLRLQRPGSRSPNRWART